MTTVNVISYCALFIRSLSHTSVLMVAKDLSSTTSCCRRLVLANKPRLEFVNIRRDDANLL